MRYLLNLLFGYDKLSQSGKDSVKWLGIVLALGWFVYIQQPEKGETYKRIVKYCDRLEKRNSYLEKRDSIRAIECTGLYIENEVLKRSGIRLLDTINKNIKEKIK